MENTECVGISQAKTESSTTLPEQIKDRNSTCLESDSSSTDAEPSTSNEASFKEEAADGIPDHRPQLYHPADLICVGSRFSQPASEIPRVRDPKERSLHRGEDPSPRNQARLGEGADGSIRAEITTTDGQTASEEIIGDPDTDNETIGHAEDAELEGFKSPKSSPLVSLETHSSLNMWRNSTKVHSERRLGQHAGFVLETAFEQA